MGNKHNRLVIEHDKLRKIVDRLKAARQTALNASAKEIERWHKVVSAQTKTDELKSEQEPAERDKTMASPDFSFILEKEFKGDVNNMLVYSSIDGGIDQVNWALENGADVHAEDDVSLREASERGHLEVVKVLLENGADVHAEEDLALQGASERGHLEVVKVLLENGADVHAYNDSAIRRALENGHLEVVKILLEAGADVHGKNDLSLQ